MHNAELIFRQLLLFHKQTLAVNPFVGFEEVKAFHLCKGQIKRTNVHQALALVQKQRVLKIQSAIHLASTLTTARSQRSNLLEIPNYLWSKGTIRKLHLIRHKRSFTQKQASMHYHFLLSQSRSPLAWTQQEALILLQILLQEVRV